MFCLFAIGYACFVLEVNIGRYLLASWLRPLAAVVVPVAVWWAVTPAEPTWVAIAVGIGLGLVPFAAVVVGMEFGARLTKRLAALVGRAVATPVSPQSAQ